MLACGLCRLRAGHHFRELLDALIAGEGGDAGARLAVAAFADDLLGDAQMLVGVSGDLREMGDAQHLVLSAAV